MKQFANNSHELSIFRPLNERAAPWCDGNSGEIKQFFHDWDEINRNHASSTKEKRESTVALFSQRPLTSIESIRIDRATVREGISHRHWPPEVVEKFLAAEVIRGR